MARIMVHPGDRSKLPTYAGITYFYSSQDYEKYVKPLWESGKLGGYGDVITPFQLKEIVGRPFSGSGAMNYEKNHDLMTIWPNT